MAIDAKDPLMTTDRRDPSGRGRREHDKEEKVFIGKASTTKQPRYDQIPHQAMRRLANRYELGIPKHGEDNWRKGLDDPDYVIERLNHVVEHCERLKEKLKGRRPKDGDDDAAAIMWGGAFLCEAIPTEEL